EAVPAVRAGLGRRSRRPLGRAGLLLMGAGARAAPGTAIPAARGGISFEPEAPGCEREWLLALSAQGQQAQQRQQSPGAAHDARLRLCRCGARAGRASALRLARPAGAEPRACDRAGLIRTRPPGTRGYRRASITVSET